MTGLNHDRELIVAVASGQGSAAIAILRLSGSNCHDLLRSCLIKRKSEKPWQMNYMTLCDFIDPQTGVVIDEVMAVMFRTPHSYTGQDAAEIYFHGSPFVLQAALRIIYSLGARHAEAGEFTRRAFLSGKIDLSEAEGINELISASTHQQWLAARQLYTGKLKDLVDSLHSQLKEAIAWLEATIDFPEEDDTSQIARDQILTRVERVKKSLLDLLASYEGGKIARQGLAVALFGEPNVGKSTLMNTLLNSERAIVTDIPGTTRDYLEEPCLVKGRLIRLIDTAGVRKGAGEIEKRGIERTFELAKNADLVLFLAENSSQESSEGKFEKWIRELNPRNFIKILTKSDLNTQEATTAEWLRISCHTRDGLEELKTRIVELTEKSLQPLSDQAFITSIRHKEAVEKALQSLSEFFKANSEGAYDEILAFELQQTTKHLVSIVGVFNTEEILDIVFGSFCVGK